MIISCTFFIKGVLVLVSILSKLLYLLILEVVIMKKASLFLLGLTPLILGFLMNSWVMKDQNSVLPSKLIGIIFLLYWVLVGFGTSTVEKTILKSAAITNLPAFLMLLLALFQEIVLRKYWANIFGLIPQFYFLPLVNISSTILGLFFPIHFSALDLISFLLMFGAYYLGGKLRNQRHI